MVFSMPSHKRKFSECYCGYYKYHNTGANHANQAVNSENGETTVEVSEWVSSFLTAHQHT